MTAFILLAVLAAFGGLCILWIVFGFLITGQRGASAVCLCRGGLAEEPVIRRYLWLYNTGLVRSPLLLVDCGLTDQERLLISHRKPNIILCTPEDLPTLLEQEREYLG